MLYMGLAMFGLLIAHILLILSDPYARLNIFKSPYVTYVKRGRITYRQQYQLRVYRSWFFNILGYYKSGILILKHRFFGVKPIHSKSVSRVIAHVHQRRFRPAYAYLISGDQFSVLYPRNLGVFYNQLLDPNTAHNHKNWECRQRLYLQSVLMAIDALSSAETPRTTVVPLGRRSVALTQVHPGGIASDAVYGVLFAIDKLATKTISQDGRYRVRTVEAANKLVNEKNFKLRHMVKSYVQAIQDPDTMLVHRTLHVSGARDGVIRRCSFYDNVVLWKTLQLARQYSLFDISDTVLSSLKKRIDSNFWDPNSGFYKNDLDDKSFSADWLIGYVTGFFDLNDLRDISRAEKVVRYVERHGLDMPLPIKYQRDAKPGEAPFIVRKFVPNYGGNAVWSYWGSEYITLLVRLHNATGKQHYLKKARDHIAAYEKTITKYGGFLETFSEDGVILKNWVYKSIVMTGWVVQFEHARYLLQSLDKN